MNLHFVRRGSGAPLVLLHGIGHRWQAWEPVLDRLAEHHDVVALDLPGFGASRVPRTQLPTTMPQIIALLGGFFETEGLGRPHLCGNSLGGAIALELGAAGLASSVTALSPAGFFTPAEGRRAIAILGRLRATTFQPAPVLRRALALPLVRAWSLGPLVARPDALSPERAVGDALALRRAPGFRPIARAARNYRFDAPIDVAVTVAWGTEDHILRPHQAERARERLAAARHVPLPGCGHVPMSDDPALVTRLVLETTGRLRSADRAG